MTPTCTALLLVHCCIASHGLFMRPTNTYADNVDQWLSSVDAELHEFNKLSAGLAWRMMMEDVNETVLEMGAALGAAKSTWRNGVCDVALVHLQLAASNGRVCLQGEPDLEDLMSRDDLTADQLSWLWKSWHNAAGPRVKAYYPDLVKILNQGARSYQDIGQVWREELDMPNLENIVKNLYQEIEPLYKMLHAVVRYELVQKYGPKVVDPVGPIPAHLLGNMWAQDWSALLGLLIPEDQNLHLDQRIASKNWTIKDMVQIAEDMYVSLGLPKMTEKFWKHSKFERNEKNSSLCHGTAANMFDEDDYRMLVCAEINMEDFYVIHHEMGHIEYYMAYSEQPALFQDGANSAFQESVGDAVMTGVMVPQHLHRLGLLSDRQLLDKQLDTVLLVQEALAKIPQIPYALLIDSYRWDIFNGKIKLNFYNEAFWKLSKTLRGILPPEPRGEQYFDAGAKFHVSDNTPYIRYFFSAILQMEMFKGLCELTLYGKLPEVRDQPVPFSLHRCDIYGSKKAGAQLKKMMQLGASENWQEALKLLTGKSFISAKPLLEYYQPVYEWLRGRIIEKNIPVGW
ncbi:Angiotensin converting enzyme [Carabus blaptoides fortunei]